MRAFVDWMVHEMNKKAGFDSGIAVVQPIDKGLVNMLNDQDGLYTLYLNGIKNGNPVSQHMLVDCINQGINPYQDFEKYMALAEDEHIRFIISNTTEAGIAYDDSCQLEAQPPGSFPAKLTRWLYRRFRHFSGSADAGCYIIPCELIEKNGGKLSEYIIQHARDWKLGDEFIKWIEQHNYFYNTLVDRIVPGYPKDKIPALQDQLGYQDSLIVEGEQFHLWVIEGDKQITEVFPTQKAGLNVIYTDDLTPYRTRKVRILNGAHTCMVPVGLLFGTELVRETVEHTVLGKFVRDLIFEEVIPTLDMPENELVEFAEAVIERFENPYVKHYLQAISLNSIAKFNTRVMPTLMHYLENGQAVPEKIVFAFASLVRFYKGDIMALNDDPQVIEFFNKTWEHEDHQKIMHSVLSNENFWGSDLTKYKPLLDKSSYYLKEIDQKGMKEAIKYFN